MTVYDTSIIIIRILCVYVTPWPPAVAQTLLSLFKVFTIRCARVNGSRCTSGGGGGGTRDVQRIYFFNKIILVYVLSERYCDDANGNIYITITIDDDLLATALFLSNILIKKKYLFIFYRLLLLL